MSFETLKEELAALNPADRRKAMGFLVLLNRTDEEREALSRKLDDNSPDRWLTQEQFEEKLRELDEAEKQ